MPQYDEIAEDNDMNDRTDQPNPADVLDPQTGKVRVLARQCSTCIFRPGDPMRLGPQRVHEVIDSNLRAGALLTCHATLPYGEHPGFGPAVCAGFWARHRSDVPAGRIAQLHLGITRVDPPDSRKQEQHQEGTATMPRTDKPHQETPAGGLPPDPRRGSRIRLLATADPHTRLAPGALGTVTRIDDLGTVNVRWDDGSSLGLIPDLDQYEILGQEPSLKAPSPHAAPGRDRPAQKGTRSNRS